MSRLRNLNAFLRELKEVIGDCWRQKYIYTYTSGVLPDFLMMKTFYFPKFRTNFTKRSRVRRLTKFQTKKNGFVSIILIYFYLSLFYCRTFRHFMRAINRQSKVFSKRIK